MKNFEIRQIARDEEIEARMQAKAILSGDEAIEALKQPRPSCLCQDHQTAHDEANGDEELRDSSDCP